MRKFATSPPGSNTQRYRQFDSIKHNQRVRFDASPRSNLKSPQLTRAFDSYNARRSRSPSQKDLSIGSYQGKGVVNRYHNARFNDNSVDMNLRNRSQISSFSRRSSCKPRNARSVSPKG